MILIENPFPLFTDNNGELLESGYIYIGEAGLNPETNPINVFWDKDLLYPAAQPIRTINGLPARSGTATPLYTASLEYSLLTKDKNQAFISSTSFYPIPVIPADDSITVAMYTAAAYPVLLVDAQTIAGAKTFTANPKILNSEPRWMFEESDASAGNKVWGLRAVIGSCRLSLFADDGITPVGDVFEAKRTGTTLHLFNITSTDFQHNGDDVITVADSASETAAGIVELATDAEVAAGTDTERAVTPAGLQAKLPLLTKFIENVSWNMDTTVSVSVAHGLTLEKIESVNIIIKATAGVSSAKFESFNFAETSEHSVVIGLFNIVLTRGTSGFFDHAGWAAGTSADITIQYKP